MGLPGESDQDAERCGGREGAKGAEVRGEAPSLHPPHPEHTLVGTSGRRGGLCFCSCNGAARGRGGGQSAEWRRCQPRGQSV